METQLNWFERKLYPLTKDYKDYIKYHFDSDKNEIKAHNELQRKFLEVYDEKLKKQKQENNVFIIKTLNENKQPTQLNQFNNGSSTVKFIEELDFSFKNTFVLREPVLQREIAIDSPKVQNKLLSDLNVYLRKNEYSGEELFHEGKLKNNTVEIISSEDFHIPSIRDQINLSDKQKELFLKNGFINIPDDNYDDELKVSLSMKEDGTISGMWSSGEEFRVNKAELFPEIKTKEDINNLNNNQKSNIMETTDFNQLQYLKDQLKYLGFGESEQLHKDLESGINSAEKKFEIQTNSDKALPGNTIDYVLKYSKSEQGGVFLNSYEASLTDNKGENTSQNFKVSKENSFTAKEALNLLEGRSVKIEFHNPKTDEREPAFVKLNLNEDKNEYGNYNYQTFYKNYGVDAAQIVEKSNLIFDFPEYRDSTIKSLEKGNVVKVKFELEDKTIEGKAVLNPQYKTLNLYDSDMNRINTNKPLQGMENDKKHDKSNVREQSKSRGI
ncbi:hypothetical protein [Chryseobacterium sp.]|uniref:hypothetical protein n=1 Tax=Chryseobacterium sp. TaxID=1871047 RepID=UPI0025C4B22C|nr:hypothetical protein [Chryseobacterium sp.]